MMRDERLAARFAAFDIPDGDEHRVGPPEGRRGWLAALDRGPRLAAGLVDQALVRAMERMFLLSDKPDFSGDMPSRIAWHLGNYSTPELLCQPERFFRPVPDPADLRLKRLGRLPGGVRHRLTFTSTYRTFDDSYQRVFDGFDGNQHNRVHLWRHAHTGGRPAAVLIHPWCGGYLEVEERLYRVRALYRAGLDVALFTLPFHGRRTPRQALFSGQLFPNRELQRTNEAFGQAAADLSVLLRWLRAEGRGGRRPVGIAGMSLGGYAAAMMAGLDAELAFAVVIMAPSSLADGLWQMGRSSPAKEEAEQAGVTLADMRRVWAIHCPLVLPCLLPRRRLMLIWLRGDRVIPRVHALAQWEHWGRPEIRDHAGGHLLQLGWSRCMKDAHAGMLARLAL